MPALPSWANGSRTSSGPSRRVAKERAARREAKAAQQAADRERRERRQRRMNTRVTWRTRLAAPFVAAYRLVRPIGRAFWHRGKAGRVVLGCLVVFVAATYWYTGSWGMALVAFGLAVLTAPVLLLVFASDR